MTRLNGTERGALVELRKDGPAIPAGRSSWRIGFMLRKQATMDTLVNAGLAVEFDGKIVVTEAGRAFDVLREENRRR